jgi:hypothetical protein
LYGWHGAGCITKTTITASLFVVIQAGSFFDQPLAQNLPIKQEGKMSKSQGQLEELGFNWDSNRSKVRWG